MRVRLPRGRAVHRVGPLGWGPLLNNLLPVAVYPRRDAYKKRIRKERSTCVQNAGAAEGAMAIGNGNGASTGAAKGSGHKRASACVRSRGGGSGGALVRAAQRYVSPVWSAFHRPDARAPRALCPPLRAARVASRARYTRGTSALLLTRPSMPACVALPAARAQCGASDGTPRYPPRPVRAFPLIRNPRADAPTRSEGKRQQGPPPRVRVRFRVRVRQREETRLERPSSPRGRSSSPEQARHAGPSAYA